MSEEQHDLLDGVMPVIGYCMSCGNPIYHSPPRMPKARPRPNPEKPAHFYIDYGMMCVSCLHKQLMTFIEKVNRGEFYPFETWDVDEEGNPHIVPLSLPSLDEQRSKESEIEEEVEAEVPTLEPTVGLLRRLWNWLY